MSNVEVHVPAVDGSLYPLIDEGESCKEVIHTLFTDDFAAPPRSMNIKVVTESGKIIKLIIPYDDHQKAVVSIDDKLL